uniref:Uncharacterized protein n=1 Tax=Romanomermis culicivorax TaxID=13658 RepID=A0A915I2D8_ROMCU
MSEQHEDGDPTAPLFHILRFLRKKLDIHMRQCQLRFLICALANCANFQVRHFYMRPMHLRGSATKCTSAI